jgi:hypothetical protein
MAYFHKGRVMASFLMIMVTSWRPVGDDRAQLGPRSADGTTDNIHAHRQWPAIGGRL